jgi:hypothetical protein
MNLDCSQSVAPGRRRHASNDDVAHLAFGVAGDDVDGLRASQKITLFL